MIYARGKGGKSENMQIKYIFFLHMSEKSSTFALFFILAYCARTCTTYNDRGCPAVLHGRPGSASG